MTPSVAAVCIALRTECKLEGPGHNTKAVSLLNLALKVVKTVLVNKNWNICKSPNLIFEFSLSSKRISSSVYKTFLNFKVKIGIKFVQKMVMKSRMLLKTL